MTQVRIPIVQVVDDEPGVCQVFEKVATMLGYRSVCHSTAEAFLAAYDPEQPGCLILDLYLPAMSGLELLEEIGKRGWQIPIVIVSGRADVSAAVAAFKAGSIDFLEKPFGSTQMEQVIRNAIEVDRRAREERAKASERETARSEIRKRMSRLTPRERQVMDLVVAGKSNRLIAEDLGVSPKTVEVHRANVMHKMAAGSLAELVKMAVAERNSGSEEHA